MKDIFYIDNHIHGSFGINFNYATYNEMKFVLKELYKRNIKGICPTLVGETPKNLQKQLSLFKQIQKELRQSLSYIKYGAPQAVLTGGGANLAIKNAVKSVLGPRRVRLAAHDDMIADSEDLLSPSYTSALSLALYSQKHGGASAAASSSLRSKAAGLFEQMLAKLGLN